MGQYTYIYRDKECEEVEANLLDAVDRAVRAKYGRCPDPAIVRRIEEEWEAIGRTDTLADVAALHELTEWLRAERHPYWVRSSGASSFLLYLLGITRANPLPPHRYCPKCGRVEWVSAYKDGFDIPQGRCCPKDGAHLIGDGHDLPHRMVFGYERGREYFEITVPTDLYPVLLSEWDTYWRRVHAERGEAGGSIRAGGVNVLCCLDRDKISDGFYDHDYGASERKAMLAKVNLLTHLPEEYRACGIVPKTIADLIALCGLAHFGCLRCEDTLKPMRRFGCTFSDLPSHRDDIYRRLLASGKTEEEAWHGMMAGSLDGRSDSLDERTMWLNSWIADFGSDIRYLFPRANDIEHILFTMKAL
ncbi:MAG: hypothetical protein J6B02_03370 [Selenomonadales bacterium]|nr:hypothetical protein [Selenomonadales bacterium]